jgi:hypothetical protein
VVQRLFGEFSGWRKRASGAGKEAKKEKGPLNVVYAFGDCEEVGKRCVGMSSYSPKSGVAGEEEKEERKEFGVCVSRKKPRMNQGRQLLVLDQLRFNHKPKKSHPTSNCCCHPPAAERLNSLGNRGLSP